MPAGIAGQLSLLSAANTPPPIPPPSAAPVAAPTSVYCSCSSVMPQAETIPRMATHIKYVPSFLRTLFLPLTSELTVAETGIARAGEAHAHAGHMSAGWFRFVRFFATGVHMLRPAGKPQQPAAPRAIY